MCHDGVSAGGDCFGLDNEDCWLAKKSSGSTYCLLNLVIVFSRANISKVPYEQNCDIKYIKKLFLWVFFWSFTDIMLLLTYFTEVEQEAVTQENAMLQVNNVRLSVENIWSSCSDSMVVVVNASSLSSWTLAVVNVLCIPRQDTSLPQCLSLSVQQSHLSVIAYNVALHDRESTRPRL